MNIINVDTILQYLGDFTLLERLFWATVELTLLAAIVWVFTRIFRKLSPRVRALLWLLVLIKPLVALCVGAAMPVFEVEVTPPPLTMVQESTPHTLPAITTAVPETEPAATPPASSATSTTDSGTTASTTATAPVQAIPATRPETRTPQPKFTWPDFHVIFAYSWILLTLLLGMYKGLDVIRLRRLIRTSNVPSTVLKERYEAIAAEIGVKHPPRFCITETLESPALAGVLMPVIMLPQWMLNDKHEAAVGWALRHELIHWKHGDTLANLLRQITQVLFFFHPLAWLAGKRWEEETELACDRALIKTEDEANEYAHRLYEVLDQLHGRRQHALATGLFATRTQVGRRIKALVTNPLRYPAKLGIGIMITLTLITMTALAAGGAFNTTERMRSIGGIIVDENDAPVEGAQISIMCGDYPDSCRRVEAETDASGHWQAEIKEEITKLSWSATHPEFITSKNNGWVNVTNELKTGTFRDVLIRGVRISGTVLDGAGKPIPDALVIRGTTHVDSIDGFRNKLAGQDKSNSTNATVTDANGQYSIMANPEDTYRRSLTVFAEGYAPQALLLDKPTNNYELTLDTGATFNGLVQDASGNPIAGVRIVSYDWIHWLTQNDLVQMWVECMKGETDASGRFSIPCLPSVGKITFEMNKDGFYGQRFTWSAEETVLDNIYRMYPKEPVHGRVIDAETGSPIKRFEIRNGKYDDWKRISAKDGTFEMENTYEVQVRARGYCLAVRELPPVQKRDDFFLEVAMKPGKTITGRILSADGKPAPDANIASVLPDEQAYIEGAVIMSTYYPGPGPTTTSNDNGKFQLDRTETPGLLVAVHTSGWLVQSLAEYDSDTPLMLTPWSRIEGIAAKDYQPQGGERNTMCAKLVQPDPWNAGESVYFRMDTDPNDDGNYSIDYVPALPLQVGQYRRRMLSHAHQIHPAPGETVQVNLYDDNTYSLQGRLSLDGLPLTEGGIDTVWNTSDNLIIKTRPKDADPDDEYANYVPFVQKDGTFTLDGLPAGEYELTATLHASLRASISNMIWGQGLTLARWTHEFSITPDLDTPLDLGTLNYELTPPLQPGQEAPEIEGTTIENDNWHLSEERGNPVLLVLWGTFDGASRVQTPILREFFQRHSVDGHLQIIGGFLDHFLPTAKDYLNQNPEPWAHKQIYIGEEDNAVTRTYGIESLPSNWLLDANGVILEANIPSNELEAIIKKYLD